MKTSIRDRKPNVFDGLQALAGALIVLLCVAHPAFGQAQHECPNGQSMIILDPAIQSAPIAESAFVLRGSTDRYAIDDVVRGRYDKAFAPNCNAQISGTATNETIWLRFDVTQPAATPGAWVLEFANEQISAASLYTAGSTQTTAGAMTGYAIPVSEKGLKTFRHGIVADVPEHHPARYYLRIEAPSAASVTASLVRSDIFYHASTGTAVRVALFTGFILAMFALNFSLWTQHGNRDFLFYCGYLIGLAITSAIFGGMLHGALGIALPPTAWEGSQRIFEGLAGCSLLMFAQRFLGLPTSLPRTNKGLKFLIASILTSLALALVWPEIFTGIFFILLVLSAALMCGISLVLGRRGHRPAWLFAMSFLVLFATILLANLIAQGWQTPFDSVNAILESTTSLINVLEDLGYVAETLIISFALGYQITVRRNEFEIAHAQALESHTKAIESQQAFDHKLNEILAKAANSRGSERERLVRQTLDSADERFLTELSKTIIANIADPEFGLPQLASEVGMTEQTLRRNVRRILDMTPVKFMREKRMEVARDMIEQRAFNSVAEVAHAVGFKTASYFSNHYRQAHGISPAEALRSAGRGTDPVPET